MTPTEVAQFLISEYGLTRREALFTAKLVEGKSVTAASQECSMNPPEARTTLNRVLLKVPALFPLHVSHKVQASDPARLSVEIPLLSRDQIMRAAVANC